MDFDAVAGEVLAAVGGRENVRANDICMTRLRILTDDPAKVDYGMLRSAEGVLGIVKRGSCGLEVVFGPGKVTSVHEALVRLTGIEPNDSVFDDIEPDASSAMLVNINNVAAPERDGADAAASEESEMSDLMSLLEKRDEQGESGELEYANEGARLLVINGPNINMLGIREPDIYGSETFQALLELCERSADEAGFEECVCFQSNHEGALVDEIQDAYDEFDGIVINPGAYTHTSIAILDAAKAVGIPMVEVHISKLEDREEFRQVSYIRQACFETVSGMGIQGYRKAIFDLAEHIGI